jgi:hypothetical protein
MSSKASVRNFLAKSKTSSKKSAKSSTKSTKSVKSTKLAKSVKAEILKKPEDLIEEVKPVLSDILHRIKNEKQKKESVTVTFQMMKSGAPLNSRIGYRLYRTFKDKKTGEPKQVYCNSAFFQGFTIRTSLVAVGSPIVKQEVMIVASGKTIQYLAENEIEAIWVYKDSKDFAKGSPIERYKQQLAKWNHAKTDIPTSSKSLTHAPPSEFIHTPNGLLIRRSSSTTSLRETSLRKSPQSTPSPREKREKRESPKLVGSAANKKSKLIKK